MDKLQIGKSGVASKDSSNSLTFTLGKKASQKAVASEMRPYLPCALWTSDGPWNKNRRRQIKTNTLLDRPQPHVEKPIQAASKPEDRLTPETRRRRPRRRRAAHYEPHSPATPAAHAVGAQGSRADRVGSESLSYSAPDTISPRRFSGADGFALA